MKNIKITLITLLVLALVISGCVPKEPSTETEQSASEIELSLADIDKDFEDLDFSVLEELDNDLNELESLI